MRFLLSVIAFCLVMITAKLYIPVAQAQECGTFDERTLMYIVCEDEEQPEEMVEDMPVELEELPTQEERIVELEKNMSNVINYLNEMTNINDIKQLKQDVESIKKHSHRSNSSGVTVAKVYELIESCKGSMNGGVAHRHRFKCPN